MSAWHYLIAGLGFGCFFGVYVSRAWEAKLWRATLYCPTCQRPAPDSEIICGQRWQPDWPNRFGGAAECHLVDDHDGPHQGHLVGSFRVGRRAAMLDG